MWFVTLVKTTQPPTKENAMKSAEVQKKAEAMGVKFHMGFMTLGPYDGVWVTEAPDEKVAMQVAMMFASELGGNSTTMPAVSFEEVVGWINKMM